ncbi:CgeB family protein [Xanthobacter sp. TB0136]|uniref:CgeB family protein n=1 Tax=Xanthobacter sp. TB0136 TaxID=3459177 RepID=UPI0040393623
MRNDFRRAKALLQAATLLEGAGRSASAGALRRGLERERLLLALAACPVNRDAQGKERSSRIRVATILDAFSTNSFADSFRGTALLPECWQSQFEAEKPQIFLCESAWTGPDTERRHWSGRVHASNRVAHENRQILLDILAYCRRQGIVSVFWNKEDPTHYGDRAHDFVKTATAFDHVFTTAQECVPDYRAEYGLVHVHALPFATNPALFSPVEIQARTDVVTFAGSWYAHHEARSIAMHHMLDSLLAGGFRLKIYDRFHGATDPKHIWPEIYAPYLHPAVPHAEIFRIYKAGRFGLNINTVTQSRTMFARRVFELMSSNTLVLSNHSVGMEEMFGRDVVFCDREPGRLKALGDAEIDAMRERNLNLVLSRHTYRHRWEQILSLIGFPFQPARETVTIAWPVQNGVDAQRAREWFRQEADAGGDRLLLVAQDGMPARDLGALMDLRAEGLDVTPLRDLEQQSHGARAGGIGTDHILLQAPAHLPPAGWLARARLHLQYAGSHVIGPAPDAGSRYRFIPQSTHGPLLLRAGFGLAGQEGQMLAI